MVCTKMYIDTSELEVSIYQFFRWKQRYHAALASVASDTPKNFPKSTKRKRSASNVDSNINNNISINNDIQCSSTGVDDNNRKACTIVQDLNSTISNEIIMKAENECTATTEKKKLANGRRLNRKQHELRLSSKFGSLAAAIAKTFPDLFSTNLGDNDSGHRSKKAKVNDSCSKRARDSADSIATRTTSTATHELSSADNVGAGGKDKGDHSGEDKAVKDQDLEDSHEVDTVEYWETLLPELYERYYITGSIEQQRMSEVSHSRPSSRMTLEHGQTDVTGSSCTSSRNISDDDLFASSFAHFYRLLLQYQTQHGHCRVVVSDHISHAINSKMNQGNQRQEDHSFNNSANNSHYQNSTTVVDDSREVLPSMCTTSPSTATHTDITTPRTIPTSEDSNQQTFQSHLLAYWVSRIRTLYDDFLCQSQRIDPLCLTKDRVDLLNQIGFEWDVLPTNNTTTTVHHDITTHNDTISYSNNHHNQNNHHNNNNHHHNNNNHNNNNHHNNNHNHHNNNNNNNNNNNTQINSISNCNTSNTLAATNLFSEGGGAKEEELRSFALIYENRFEQLMQFKRTFGHTLVPRTYKEDKAFGEWVHLQRKKYRKGILKPDRIARLNSIGFIWNVSTGGRRSHSSIQKRSPTWQYRIRRCVVYKKKFGHLFIPQPGQPFPDGTLPVTENDQSLCEWAQQIRDEYKLIANQLITIDTATLLTNSRIEELIKMGFIFCPDENNGTTDGMHLSPVTPTLTDAPSSTTPAFSNDVHAYDITATTMNSFGEAFLDDVTNPDAPLKFKSSNQFQSYNVDMVVGQDEPIVTSVQLPLDNTIQNIAVTVTSHDNLSHHDIVPILDESADTTVTSSSPTSTLLTKQTSATNLSTCMRL